MKYFADDLWTHHMVTWSWQETIDMVALIGDNVNKNFACRRHSNFSRADVPFVLLLIHALMLATIFWTAAFPVNQHPQHLSRQLARLF